MNNDYLNLLGLRQFYDKLKTIFAFKNDLINIKGEKGETGAQGVSIVNVEQTTTSITDSGENIITVTLSNGNTSTFKIKNGSKGNTGAPGPKGDKGDTPSWKFEIGTDGHLYVLF